CNNLLSKNMMTMENQTLTKQLLDTYYKGFAAKSNWEDTIAEDFKYVGGDMTNTQPVGGKQAYIEIIKRFSQRFESMRVKQMIAKVRIYKSNTDHYRRKQTHRNRNL